ncbi:MAG TPA: ATP-binding protein [Candidatus Dormibacteraeota bacterium]|nr:ATP-binding protein [Candidatus Dormibacteraeota bacterium]
MKRWLAGTRIRLTLAFGGVLLAAIVIADVIVYLLLAQAETGAAADALVAQAGIIASGIEDVNGEVRFGSGDLPTETQQGIAVDAAIVAAAGSVTQTSGQTLTPTTLRTIAANARKQATPIRPFSTRDGHGVPRLVYAVQLQSGQGAKAVLIVSRSISELQSTLAQTIWTMALLSLLLVAAGTLLAHGLTGRVLLPVRRIAATAASLSQHDLHRRVDVEVPPDELGELVQTFNDMLARLEASFESLRRFTADASHELRSPLTLMRSEIEGTLAHLRTPAEYQRTLRELETEVEHMARMADQLLILARADAGALRPATVALDVADFLHESGARWRPVAEQQGVGIEVDAPDSGSVSADPDLLRRVIDNLLDNAIRHSPVGTAVELTGSRTSDGWQIDVHDHGPGIPSAARRSLFERFARSDASRPRDGGGAGLGLALSRAIAEAHGGSLRLAGQPGDGATFRLVLSSASSYALTQPLGNGRQ